MPTPAKPSLGRGARARILAAARERFRDPGINATGVADLCAAARVSKRTLYQHFPSKDDVVVAWLRECEADPGGTPLAVLRRGDLAPRARLLELFAVVPPRTGPGRGDPLLAVAVELADPAHPARRLAAQQELRLQQQLTDLARGAGARSPERVGRTLALLRIGLTAQALVADPGDVGEVGAEARRLAAAVLREAIDGP